MILKLLIGGGLLYALGQKASKELDKITWELHPVQLKDIKLLNGGYYAYLTIKNHTDFPISLKGYQGHILRAGQVIGDINITGQIELPAGGTKTIEAFVKIKQGALDQLLAILSKKSGLLSEPISINSYLKTSLIDIPIRQTLEFLKIS